jgi:hypothetical protein
MPTSTTDDKSKRVNGINLDVLLDEKRGRG